MVDYILDDSEYTVEMAKERYEQWLSENAKSKGLTPDQKRLHWEVYAKKTERQEEMFKRVFNDVFGKQAKEISDYYSKNDQLPALIDEETAKKFQPAIELVYESAFQEAV